MTGYEVQRDGGKMAGPYTRRVDAHDVIAAVKAEQRDYVSPVTGMEVVEVEVPEGGLVFDLVAKSWLRVTEDFS